MVFHPLWLPPPWWVAFPQDAKRSHNITSIHSCMTPNSGFGNWPGGTAYLECCFQAFVTLNSLDAIATVDTAGVHQFLLDRELATGGFADEPGGRAVLFDTFYALVCLNLFGALDRTARATHIDFVRNHIVQERNGAAFSCQDDWRPELIATFWGVVSLYILEALSDDDAKDLCGYVEDCWDPTLGAYGATPNHRAYLEYTYCALAIHALLSQSVNTERVEQVVNFVKNCFDADTSLFGETPGAPGTLADSMWAAACLALLGETDALDLRAHKRAVREVEPRELWSLHCQLSVLNYLTETEPYPKANIISIEHVPETNGYRLLTTLLHERGVLSSPSRDLDIADLTPTAVEQLLNSLEDAASQRSRNRHSAFLHILQDVSSEITATWLPSNIWSIPDGHYAFVELTADPELLGVPLELAVVGRDLLGVRMSCGRMIRSERAHVIDGDLRPGATLKILLLGGSHQGRREVLPAAGREVQRIASRLAKIPNAACTVVVGRDLTRARVRSLVNGKRWDIIHFSGHTFANGKTSPVSGIELCDGPLEARILAEWTGPSPPRLVFINGCAARKLVGFKTGLSRWAHKGMAMTWAEKGVAHIGCYWSIEDGASSRFAERFYVLVGDGLPVGEALRIAKARLRNQGLSPMGWAGYSLVGSPRLQLCGYRFSPH